MADSDTNPNPTPIPPPPPSNPPSDASLSEGPVVSAEKGGILDAEKRGFENDPVGIGEGPVGENKIQVGKEESLGGNSVGSGEKEADLVEEKKENLGEKPFEDSEKKKGLRDNSIESGENEADLVEKSEGVGKEENLGEKKSEGSEEKPIDSEKVGKVEETNDVSSISVGEKPAEAVPIEEGEKNQNVVESNGNEMSEIGRSELLGVSERAVLKNSSPVGNENELSEERREGTSEVVTSSATSASGTALEVSKQKDGQIVSDSDEESESEGEGGGKELFDSAALAALLRAATGASSDGNATFNASDAARIFSVDRPVGLGSSMPSLRPLPARQPPRSSLFGSSELAAVEDESNMSEEDKKVHDQVEQIRVKFLRLVHRSGHSPEDTIAAQVLYRLGLAEGIKRGRQTNRFFSLESAKKKGIQLEEAGQADLDFSCNVLVLGKSGVGKSATINSIFGEQVATTNAFRRTTNGVKEIVGMVDGVKVRFIDTPGLNPSVMDQSANKKILMSIKKYTKKCPPDIVLYVDRLDTQTRDFNDLPLLRSVATTLGSSIWFNAIVALTHAACAPPDGPNGTSLVYDVFVAQRSHVVQHSIRQAAGDMRLMNPVALVENHPNCRRNREGERVLPNGTSWRLQLLLLCYSSKTLSEANTLLKLQDPPPGKLFGFRRSPPLPYLLSSLLQSRQHPKVANDQGDNVDSDIDLDDLSDSDQEEDEYDQLPPFKPLKKSQMEKLTKEQKNAYLDEYEYRVKLLQKKQWKYELRRLKELRKRGKNAQNDVGYGEIPDDYDQDAGPATIAVPMPDMTLPPSFDCDNSSYRYRFLEPTSQFLTRPVLDSQGWDHDCGYDGVSLEQNLAIAGHFPTGVAIQITKDKKEFNIHLDSSFAAKHGENGSTLAGFDLQSIGKQLAYIVRSESKFKTLKKNKTAAGISMIFLGENVATGVKLEDQLLVGNRVSLVASTGAIRSQGDMAYGANMEAKLREKDYPIGQDLTTLGLSLMKWHGDLSLGANLQSQFSIGRKSKMTIRLGLNNKRTGQISIRTSSSEQLQIALLGIIPLALSIYQTIWPGESYLVR